MKRLYCFCCFTEDGGCGHQFEIVIDSSEISEHRPECPSCSRGSPVSRDYNAEGVSGTEGVKTVGMLAAQNADKFSEDKKQHLKEKWKTKKT